MLVAALILMEVLIKAGHGRKKEKKRGRD
jgi:hypothetical protein